MRPKSAKLKRWVRSSVMELILLFICVVLACQAKGFFNLDNLLNILRNVSMQGIIAFGMTMVIISGEIDLSVGSAVAFGGCLAAYLAGSLSGIVGMFPAVMLAILFTSALGFGTGSAAGYIRARFAVPTFITTLALMTILRGAAELITGGFPLTPFPQWFNFLGGGYVVGIPFPAIVFLSVFAIVQFIMSYTCFGRSIYAVGGNSEAARLSGINVRNIKILVMGTVGLLAAISGVMLSAQIMSGNATVAQGWELDVIAAVIIGGTSLTGGSGTLRGTLIGVIFLGVLVNGMTLLNVSEYWQHVVKGVLILSAVLINRMQGQPK